MMAMWTSAQHFSAGYLDPRGEPFLSPSASQSSSRSPTPFSSPRLSRKSTPATSGGQWLSPVCEDGHFFHDTAAGPSVASPNTLANEAVPMKRWDTSYLFSNDPLPCPSGVTALPCPKEHSIPPIVRTSDNQLLDLLLDPEGDVPVDPLGSFDSTHFSSSVPSTGINSPALPTGAADVFISRGGTSLGDDSWLTMPPTLNMDLAPFMPPMDPPLLAWKDPVGPMSSAPYPLPMTSVSPMPPTNTAEPGLASHPTVDLASLVMNKIPGPAIPAQNLSSPAAFVLPSAPPSVPPAEPARMAASQPDAHRGVPSGRSGSGRYDGKRVPSPRSDTPGGAKAWPKDGRQDGVMLLAQQHHGSRNGSRKRPNLTPLQPARKSQRGPPARTSQRAVEKPTSFPCASCGKVFHRKYNLLAHELMHDPSHPRPYFCPAGKCRKAFARKYDACRHYRQIHCRHEGAPPEWIHRIVDTRRALAGGEAAAGIAATSAGTGTGTSTPSAPC